MSKNRLFKKKTFKNNILSVDEVVFPSSFDIFFPVSYFFLFICLFVEIHGICVSKLVAYLLFKSTRILFNPWSIFCLIPNLEEGIPGTS